MLFDFVDLSPGDWVVQNAANSVVGRFVIAIARRKGWRTVNVVRREELIPELRELGADVVVTDASPLSKQIDRLTERGPVRLGLNAVGGRNGLEAAKSLAPGGTLVTYGGMAREPLPLSAGLQIFKDIRFLGFWISQWYRQANADDIRAVFAELFPLFDTVRVLIAQSYPLTEATQAVRHAQQGERKGKIIITMNAE